MSLVTPAPLAEERARGSLEVLLSTPISTRASCWANGLAHYRAVLWLALLPAVVAVVHAIPTGRWLGVPLVIATILAEGAASRAWDRPGDLGAPARPRRHALARPRSSSPWPGCRSRFCSSRQQALGASLASASPLFGLGLLTAEIARAHGPGMAHPRQIRPVLDLRLREPRDDVTGGDTGDLRPMHGTDLDPRASPATQA